MDTVEVEPSADSPLDIEGIDLDITTDEIVAFIAKGRRFSGQGFGRKLA